MRTSFPQENGELAASPKDSPNILEALGGESEQNVKFPKRQRHRGKVLVTIYRRPDCYHHIRQHYHSIAVKISLTV